MIVFVNALIFSPSSDEKGIAHSSETNGMSPHLANPITGTPSESDSSAERPKVSRNRDGIREKWDACKTPRIIVWDCHPKKYILHSSHSSEVSRNSILSAISAGVRQEQSSNKGLSEKVSKSSFFKSPSQNTKKLRGSSPVFSVMFSREWTSKSNPFSFASREKKMKFMREREIVLSVYIMVF